MSKTDKFGNLAQIIGELVLYIPLLIISTCLRTLTPCLISMVSLFVFKQFYDTQFHFAKTMQGNCNCAKLSYIVFIVVGLFYSGLTYQFWFLRNQPMLVVIIAAGIAWGNAGAGKWQLNYYLATAEKKQNELPALFNIQTATESEIVVRCKEKHVSEDAKNALLMRYIQNMPLQQIADILKIEKSSVDTRACSINRSNCSISIKS